MTKSRGKELYDIWERRWKCSGEAERLTYIGRLLFKVKKKALTSVIKDLAI